MKKVFCKLVSISGYTDVHHFATSTFHPDRFVEASVLSGLLASIAYYFKTIFGIELPVGIALILLFMTELYTGIKASKKAGHKFDSALFGKGWLKLFIYMIMIGCSHVLAIYVPVKPFFGIEFNIYEWLHYGFYNFVLINLFWSNIENFIKLGWDEYLPILKRLKKYTK